MTTARLPVWLVRSLACTVHLIDVVAIRVDARLVVGLLLEGEFAVGDFEVAAVGTGEAPVGHIRALGIGPAVRVHAQIGAVLAVVDVVETIDDRWFVYVVDDDSDIEAARVDGHGDGSTVESDSVATMVTRYSLPSAPEGCS